MSWKATFAATAALLLTSANGGGAIAQSTNPTPTCSDALGIEVHGQHVVGDYVSGIGHENLDWPPSGQDIGDAVSENGGVAIAGGPGPGFHFIEGVAPGASFCTDSRSPGIPHD